MDARSFSREVGLDKALSCAVTSREFGTPDKRAIFEMVADRELNPSNKLAMEERVGKDVVIYPGFRAARHSSYIG